jgi:hypothetical protein
MFCEKHPEPVAPSIAEHEQGRGERIQPQALLDQQGEPFRFLRGGLLSFANAIVWWQDQFQVRYTLRAT